ncbi:hypothetical protein HUJ04_003828 [Dendroctonus ponderosae]|nr:hypothetical protein HUJ04_003828 [Dendroctonus ponderosae]
MLELLSESPKSFYDDGVSDRLEKFISGVEIYFRVVFIQFVASIFKETQSVRRNRGRPLTCPTDDITKN